VSVLRNISVMCQLIAMETVNTTIIFILLLKNIHDSKESYKTDVRLIVLRILFCLNKSL